MNRFLRKLLSILYPFYPFWAWAAYAIGHILIDKVVNVIMMPFALIILCKSNRRMPLYLKFFGFFTLYHLASVFYFNLIPADTTVPYFIISDYNVFAFVMLIIIENLRFDKKFIATLTRNIFYVVIIALVVTLIQINNPEFFLSTEVQSDSSYLEQSRNFSIFSWTNLNSLGISFPILVAILLSAYSARRIKMFVIAISGIVVSFLTRSRYVMISTLIAFSQLIFTRTIKLKKRTSYIFIFLFSIILLGLASNQFGIDTSKIIDDRILEKNSDFESASVRVASYYIFLQKFPEHPIIGVGPKTRDDVLELLRGKAPFIHVGYLSYLYFYGVVGASLLFIALFYLIKRAHAVGKKYNYWGTYYGIITLCAANTTLVYFNLGEMGVIISVIYLRYFTALDEQENVTKPANLKPYEEIPA
jgi:hypothetical protein